MLGEFGAIGLDLVAAIPLHDTIKPTAALAAPLPAGAAPYVRLIIAQNFAMDRSMLSSKLI